MKKTTKLLCFSLATLSLCALGAGSPKLISTSAMVSEDADYSYEEIIESPKENTNTEGSFGASSTTDARKPQFIVVFGGGKVSAAPDIAYVTVGVESLNSDLQLAVKENNDTIMSLINYLKEKGIAEEDIKTKRYSVYQKHDYTFSDKFLGYQASSTLEIKFRDLDSIGSHITELTALGANQLGGITFDCEDVSSYYQEALKLAIEDARAKASTFTDRELEIAKITEECVYTCMPYRATDTLISNAETVMKGSMEIEAKIKVVFKI